MLVSDPVSIAVGVRSFFLWAHRHQLCDSKTNEYNFKAYSNTEFKKKKKFEKVGKLQIYPVGRLSICIEDSSLVTKINGRRLDFVDAKFIVT